MRRNQFAIPGAPNVVISVSEQVNGSILFELSQTGTEVADLRGLFFDVKDASVIPHLAISGTDVTAAVFKNDGVRSVTPDVNMNGAASSPFDIGVAFGTPGIGEDDIRATSFVLSSTAGPLTLDLIANVDFGARLTSVGTAGGERTGSEKYTTISSAAPDAIDDAITTDEDNGTSSTAATGLLSNDNDADGDSLVITKVNGSAGNVASQVTLQGGGLLTVNANGSYSYDPNDKFEYLAVGEKANESFTYEMFDNNGGYDVATVVVTINGVNDAPEATDDTATTHEDIAVIVDVVLNDTDVDLSDDLFVSDIISGPSHGIVTFAGDEITYTPDVNFSGMDSLVYEVSDGNGGFDTATLDLTVVAVADAPQLDVVVSQGAAVNEVRLDVSSLLTDTDGSESLELFFDGIPNGVTLWNGTTEITGGRIANPASLEELRLLLPATSDTDFDLTVRAVSTESSNGDQATTSKILDIIYEYNENDFFQEFQAQGQSIWDAGNAFRFADNRFLGLDVDETGGFNAFVYGDYKFDMKAGFQSDLALDGGTINASLSYDLGFDTRYNKTTDFLVIDPLASLNLGSFETFGPSLDYELDFIFQLAGYYKGGLDFGDLGKAEIVNFTLPKVNETLPIIDYDSETSPPLNIELPYGLSVDLQWPTLNTNGSSAGGNTFTSQGQSNNALQLNLDVDQAVADLFLGGTNPLNPSFSIDIALAKASLALEILGLDLSAGLNFLQEFQMDVGDLGGVLVFEDNSTQAFNLFGDDLTFSNASSRDANDDGKIEFAVLLDPDVDLNNDTDLGLNLGYDFRALSVSGSYEILGVSESFSAGPVFQQKDATQVASFDIIDSTFDLNFGQETVTFIA
jgi:VCBS repeat-containing protein